MTISQESRKSHHPSKTLWDLQHRCIKYPPTMAPVHTPIPGRAFFPGGYGLAHARKDSDLPLFPTGKVMAVGQDFETEENYEKSLHAGREPEGNRTWQELLKLLNGLSINTYDVFFTNFFMGVRKEGKSTGPCPGRKDSVFVDNCMDFFLDQLRVQRPSLLLLLGKETVTHASKLSPQLSDLQKASSFADIDSSKNGPVRHMVQFHGIPEYATTVAILVHPSFRNSNVGRRVYRGEAGHKAEVNIIRDAMTASCS